VDRYTADAAQFTEAMAAVEASPELVRVGVDGRGRERFSTREMLGVEQRLEAASYDLAGRSGHGIPRFREGRLVGVQAGALARAEGLLEGEQLAAFQHVTEGADLSVVVGYAGTGKSTMLGVARAAWEAAIAAIETTREQRLALEARAREAVRRWAVLGRRYDQAERGDEREAARQAVSGMEAFAKELKQDPQLDSLLRQRGRDFGIEDGSRLDRVVRGEG
jgi:AAA domain